MDHPYQGVPFGRRSPLYGVLFPRRFTIQLHTSGLTGGKWFKNYGDNREEVEMDNIARHETPIVQSLGLEPRVRYR